MSDNFKMIAKTFFGFEDILANELLKLGAQKIEKGLRNVTYFGDKGFLYKSNLSLRTALKILKPILEFRFIDIDDYYKQINNFNWESLMDVDSSFVINSVVFHSKIFNNSKYASLKAKDAIVDRFRDKFKSRPDINSNNPDLKIEIHVNRNLCTVSLDSSGESLHKRGYKKFNSIAPLNEVLAAGVILMSEWDKNSDFLDPMCGTGTILIEAAMIARNIAPNLNRSFFAFEKWKDWDENLFELVEKSVLNKIIEFDHKFYGFDISNSMIKKAEKNIEISQVDVDIEVFTKDFLKSSKDDNDDLFIIINPPYDKRISADVKILYKSIGDTLKNNYQFSNVWLITANLEAIKSIGLKASKRIKLFNANLESRLLNYEIYPGTKKNKK
ncbi:MAG: RNA methyltransferase [Flavobacteriaceae bacterium]|nr:RNA methyltransferase [Flavobacteriaceae bacterium]|tara:strand:+ start:24983 stop:26137 length:1155 start_codon:yes stop_codon:yes gene_type:complete